MARLPFNVHVFVCCKNGEQDYQYLLLKYPGSEIWQGPAGGGKGHENPAAAARREVFEEIGIDGDRTFYQLSTVAPVPVTEYSESHLWGDDLYVIPQYYFAVVVPDQNVTLSSEHDEYRWVNYEEALQN